MLNEKGTRELVYVARIDEVKPIPGKDRVECAVVKGWTIMVRKGVFKPGDLGVYFEIDSKVPAKEPFEFLAAKNYKIKTQKYGLKDAEGKKIGQFWSQGLLMSAEDFNGVFYQDGDGREYIHMGKEYGGKDYAEGEFLTEILGVTYSTEEDNKRKAPSADKYKKMAARHPKLFQKPFVKWLYKKNWGKVLLFVFLGKKKDKRTWPAWVVKTDEERIQNCPELLKSKDIWVATEKIDGSSTTFTMKRGTFFREPEYYVCSRNVCFDTPEKADKCYYDTNIYLEMAEKYNMREVLESILEEMEELEFVTIQGETYGEGVQKRTYSIKGHDLAVFNVIFGYKDGRVERLNPIKMTMFMQKYKIPCVPIVNCHYLLPNAIGEMLDYAADKSMLDGGMREGVVVRSLDGAQSFKAVSNEFLVKYHG